MGRTKDEINQLIDRANVYKGRIWKTQGKEFRFISAGVAIDITVTDSANKKNEESYQINGIILRASDGTLLPKTLEQIINHFQKEDEQNKKKIEINQQSEPDKPES